MGGLTQVDGLEISDGLSPDEELGQDGLEQGNPEYVPGAGGGPFLTFDRALHSQLVSLL